MRQRGTVVPSERQEAISTLWLKGKVSLAMAEQIVLRWEWLRWLRTSGRWTR